jgi:phospholipid/cholesterol/gamma-HCH transport system substrate-binding protein
MEYRSNEIRAGVFLLLSFVVLVVLVFAVSDIQSLFQKKKEVKVLFLYSEGIEKNTQVRLSGIRVGKVADVRISPQFPDKVEIILSILNDTVVKKDSQAAIKTLGLVGAKYIELTGGTPGAPALEPGGTIIGAESFKLEDLTKAALDVVGKLQNIATNLDHMLGDPALARSLRTTVKNLQDTSENIKTMTANKDEVAQTLKNLQDTSENVKTMTANKDEVAQTLKNLPVLLKKIDESADNLKALTEKSDKLLGDNKKNIDEMIANFRDISKNMKDMTEEVKKSPWKLLRKP